jgi:folate-binding protein YgfZ
MPHGCRLSSVKMYGTFREGSFSKLIKEPMKIGGNPHEAKTDQEYQALHQGVGFLEMEDYSLLEVRGHDRARFLHGLLTNDVKSLQPGQGCAAAMLNLQGKTLALMQVLCLEDSFWLVLPLMLLDKVKTHLQKYIISDQVELHPQPEEWAVFSFQGGRSQEWAGSIFNWSRSSSPHHHQLIALAETPVRVVATDRCGWGGIDLIVPRNARSKILHYLIEEKSLVDLVPVTLETLNVVRVESGIPWYGIDVDDSQIPLEARLEKTISYSKGCYLGQEIIARCTFRGHLNRKLMGVILEGEAMAFAGDPVFQEEREVGWVTSPVYSPTLHCPIALAYLRQEVWPEGTPLEIVSQGVKRGAKVANLPFVFRQEP